MVNLIYIWLQINELSFAHRSKGENFLVLRRLVRNIMH